MTVAVLLGFFNTDFVSGYILTVEGIHRNLGFSLLGHLDKAKPLRTTGLFVYYQVAGLHYAVNLNIARSSSSVVVRARLRINNFMGLPYGYKVLKLYS